MKLTHYIVDNEGSVQEEVQDMEGHAQEEVQYTEGSEQDKELVAPENKRIKSSSTATTQKKKPSDNTKTKAMSYSLHIFRNFAQLIAT